MANLISAIALAEEQRQRKDNPWLTVADSSLKGSPYDAKADWQYNLLSALATPFVGGVARGVGNHQLSEGLTKFGSGLQQALQEGTTPQQMQQLGVGRYAPSIIAQRAVDKKNLDYQRQLINARNSAYFGGDLSTEGQALFERVAGGKGTPQDAADLYGINPRAAQQARILGEGNRRQGRWSAGEARKDRKQIFPGRIKVVDYEISQTRLNDLLNRDGAMAKLVEQYETAASMPDDDVFGTIASIDAALQGQMFNTWRELTNSGARLEGREAAILQKLVKSDFRGNAWDWAVRVGLGENPQEFARIMSSITEKAHNVEMLRAGFISPIKGLDYYPIRDLTTMAFQSPVITRYLDNLDLGQFDPNTTQGMMNLLHLKKYEEMKESFKSGELKK